MSSGRISLSTVTRRNWSLVAAAAIATCLLPFTGHGARADETFKEIATMAVPVTPLTGFDISFEEPVLDIYLLADRTDASVDVFDADQLAPLFHVSGFTGNIANANCGTNHGSDCSGPDGVATVHHRYVYAGDGDSTVKVIDLLSQKIVNTIPTGGTYRADELAVDPRDGIVMIANDADSPPFVTFISTKTQTVLGHLKFSDATNGLEQPIWNPKSGLFYQAVPEVSGNKGHGEIAVISPTGMNVLKTFSLDCEPAGLALGPDDQALVGCSDAAVRVISLHNGHVLATFPTVADTDQVWFNPGDNHYFGAAGSDPSGPVLGVIDGERLKADATIKSVVGNHSVAADPLRNHVFLPSRADASDTNCTQGCVKVYAPQGQDDRAGKGRSDDHKMADR
jgi:hypothetical protein